MRFSSPFSPLSVGKFRTALVAALSLGGLASLALKASAQLPAVDTVALIKQTEAEKPKFAQRQQRLLEHRSDRSKRACASSCPKGLPGNSSPR